MRRAERYETVACDRCGAEDVTVWRGPAASGTREIGLPTGWRTFLPPLSVTRDICPACTESFDEWWEKPRVAEAVTT